MNKLYNMITMSKRAGKLIAGFDSVKESVLQGKAALVLTAYDLSEKTLKEVAFLTEEGTPHIHLPQEITVAQLEQGLGKRVGVLAVTDEGLAAKIQDEWSRYGGGGN